MYEEEEALSPHMMLLEHCRYNTQRYAHLTFSY